MRYHSLFPVLLLLLAGCDLPEDDWGIVKTIWNEFPWWSVIWRVTVWTLLGIFVGIVGGVLMSLLLKRNGAYRLPWPRVRYWLTITMVVLNLIAMPLLFGAIGAMEGLHHASDVALRHSRVGKEWLPQIAEVAADALICVDCFLAEEEAPNWDEVQKRRAPINVPRMLAKLDKLKAGAAEKMLKKAKEHLFADHPEWQGTAAETVADWTLPLLFDYLINHEMQRRLAKYGVPDVLSELQREARKDGDDLLTYAELTAFLTERVLIPLVLFPLKNWIRSTQTALLATIAAWFVVPVLLLWLTRCIAFWWKRRELRRMCVDKV